MAKKEMCYGRAPEGYDWYDMLRQYKEYKETNKRNPRSSGGSPEEARLYYWMYNQTRLIKNGHMSDEHLEALLDAGVDIPNKGNVVDNYTRKVVSFKQGDKNLSGWVSVQAKLYSEGQLSGWRIEIWNTYFDVEYLNTHGSRNQAWLERLEAYAKRLGGAPDTSKEYLDAAVWFNHQVDADTEGSLRQWQKTKIAEKGLELKKLVSSKQEVERLTKYAQYKRFLESHREVPKASYGRSDYEKSLRNWAYTEIKAIRRGSRSKEWISELAKLGIVA